MVMYFKVPIRIKLWKTSKTQGDEFILTFNESWVNITIYLMDQTSKYVTCSFEDAGY
jgi:hypothetical protein